MGLTSITIENFKGIGAPVTVPLRPITLLFGANSAGKSTVIQALQYAWEVLENRNPDVDRTRLGGQAIDLGGFRNLVHKHDLERSISITLEFSGELKAENYLSPEFYYSQVQEEIRSWQGMCDVTDWLQVDPLSVRIATAWDYGAGEAFVKAYEVGFGGTFFGRIEVSPDGVPHLVVNADHHFFPVCLRDDDMETNYGNDVILATANYFGIMDRLQVSKEELRKLVELCEGLSPDQRNELIERLKKEKDRPKDSAADKDGPQKPVFLVGSVIPEWGRLLWVKKRPVEGNERGEPDEEVAWVLSQLLLGAGESVLHELRGLRYLGPLREVPDRNQAAPLAPSRERWANGLGAWDALLRKVPWDEEGPCLVDKCSEYLHDTLEMPYTLRREDRIQLPINGGEFSLLRVLASNFEDSEQEDLQRLVGRIEELERIPVVQLRDEKNGIDVALMDVGVGISQVLPVVVGAVESDCTVFAVEQPELHIHPAVQVNLADVFLREVLGEDKKPRIFLLETHSEHLVLRIMRRMRETCDGVEMPLGFPPVTPEDVAVLYIEMVGGRTCVREMPLNERGELIKAWPGGFFEEGLRETF